MLPFKLRCHVSKKLRTSHETNDSTSYAFHDVTDTPPNPNMQYAHIFPNLLRNWASFLASSGQKFAQKTPSELQQDQIQVLTVLTESEAIFKDHSRPFVFHDLGVLSQEALKAQ
jgi:hypothetical protein